ncbi:hypothetical protein [Duncaniella freteri]|uniref:hypothetical protein n=1 Tax=Duncaniella freteri TaxID=2530391 RepID=UPI0025581B9A|nr:hypothetical protein [Duncaniella freteri]
MRPKTVWLYELLDTCKACGGRKGMFGPWNKNTSRRRRSGDFYSKAVRIFLRRTFSQVKQPIQTRLSMVRPDSKWLPR